MRKNPRSQPNTSCFAGVFPCPGKDGKQDCCEDRYDSYDDKQLKSLLGEQWQVDEIYYGGLLLYPLLYGVENAIDAFSKKRSYWQDYKLLRSLRAWEFSMRFGKMSYNIAMRCHKINS